MRALTPWSGATALKKEMEDAGSQGNDHPDQGRMTG